MVFSFFEDLPIGVKEFEHGDEFDLEGSIVSIVFFIEGVAIFLKKGFCFFFAFAHDLSDLVAI